MGLRAMLKKGPTPVQILSWPHQGSNHRPSLQAAQSQYFECTFGPGVVHITPWEAVCSPVALLWLITSTVAARCAPDSKRPRAGCVLVPARQCRLGGGG